MIHMKEWRGKNDPDDKSGEAEYMVEGEIFIIPLPSFSHAQRLDDLLYTAFRQGKDFAFNAVKSDIVRALEKAEVEHSLAML